MAIGAISSYLGTAAVASLYAKISSGTTVKPEAAEAPRKIRRDEALLSQNAQATEASPAPVSVSVSSPEKSGAVTVSGDIYSPAAGRAAITPALSAPESAPVPKTSVQNAINQYNIIMQSQYANTQSAAQMQQLNMLV